jgi:UDP-N-acetylglucosamine--N-acetylmuramyl-(pentapeptide) pyrophosphoryl-undecaprenol N-acetylglucosamine transferase
MSRYAVIAGGGTAGHVSPGLAVANALVNEGHAPDEILFVGTERGIENELVPAAGFELATVSGAGILGRSPVAAAKGMLAIGRGVVEATRLLRSERPRVILALGGYASVACAVAALPLRIPIVVHEQNAVPGAANKLVARWAKLCAVSFSATDLPRTVLTGNPVRPEILAAATMDRSEARHKLGVPDEAMMVVATGGSLGALRINRAVANAVEALSSRSGLVIHHVIGERDWDVITKATGTVDGPLDYRAVRYERDMPTVLAAADLVVSRAGASITAEIASMGVPSILVPLPGAPGDHQTKNARVFVNAGAAVLVRDRDCTGKRLISEIDRLMDRSDKLSLMSERARQLGRPDAAEAVAALMEENAK